MATLLEMYESYANGQKRQFVQQVNDYGKADFARDVQTELADGVLSETEALDMLVTVLTLD